MKKPCSPGWLVPVLAVSTVASVADLAFAPDTPDPAAFLWGVGLAAGSALLAAGLLAGSSLGLSLLPWPVRWGAWLAAALGLGLLLADELWAFDKLGTKDHRLAVMTLALCGAAGFGLGGLAAGVQGRAPDTPGLLLRLGLRWRLCAAALLLAAAGGMVVIDRTWYPGLYEEVHLGLRIASLFLATVAVLLAGRGFSRMPRRVRAGAAAGAALATALTVLTLGPSAVTAVASIDSRPYPSLFLELLRRSTDLDRDGYSPLLAGGDCAPWDPAVHPGAAEIPGNGIDDNCLGGDLASRADYDEAVEDRPMPGEPAPLNVVLITVDAMRADRLRQAGYQRPVTPEISALADGSLVFANAYGTGSWTSIAVPTMMRSTYARRLRWTSYMETSTFRLVRLPFAGKLREEERPRHMFLLPSHERRKPLAWWLRRRGLHTMGVVNDGFSRMLSKPVGTGLGFAEFREVDEQADRRRGDAATADLAIAAVKDAVAAGREPFYLWVHFFGPHAGRFRPPKQSLKYFETDGYLYDDRLAYTDTQVGRLLRKIDALPLARPVATILTADHGEEIVGKKTMHGNSVSEDALRVPLIVRAPGLPPRTVDAPVSTIDLLPTVLALTGTPAPPGLDGVDLLAVARGEPVSRRLGLVADNWNIDKRGQFRRDQVAVFDGRHKLILNRQTGARSFEVQATGIGAPDPAARQRLERILLRYLDESAPLDYDAIDEEIDLSYLPVGD
jgi:arylsulfatase A-like enzyme